jgi:hypothetical protein
MWKRLSVLSLLGVACTGCFQSHGALMRGASYPPSPLASARAVSADKTAGGVANDRALSRAATLRTPELKAAAPVAVQTPRLREPQNGAAAASDEAATPAVAVASAGG